jgi:hypothetical protein
MRHRVERVVVRPATVRKRQQAASTIGLERLALVAVLAIATLGVGVARTPLTAVAAPVSGGAPAGSAAELKLAAADLLEQATATGGAGYRFEIVQRSTIQARPDGPKLPAANPDDPQASPLGEVDAQYLMGLTESGFVTPAGFSMEMRAGPGEAAAPADPRTGELQFRALVRDGKTYRDDGLGWYATDAPPGIGLDPASAALLPRLLRNASDARDVELDAVEGELGRVDPRALRALTAAAVVADLPGIIAADAASFTKLIGPIALTFDSDGRVIGIVVTAHNTRMETFDLVVVTEIAIHYDGVPADLPDASPLWDGVLPKTNDQ